MSEVEVGARRKIGQTLHFFEKFEFDCDKILSLIENSREELLLVCHKTLSR